MYTAAIITVSDRASRGEYEDKTGPELVRMLEESGYEIRETTVIPDEREQVEATLIRLADQQISLILTAPGIPEAMRAASMRITPRGMLSRAAAGIRGHSLIINLPGSPKAARENLEAVLPALDHGLAILSGEKE